MNRRFDLLVFDWDGTLMDSAGVIADSIQASFADLGLPVPSDEAARHVIGLGLSEALTALAPGVSQEGYEAIVARYRHHFLAQDASIPLFPGAREAIGALADKGFKLAIATGKSRVGLDRALEATSLRSYFQLTRCADECLSKPHPQMLLEIMAKLGVAPARTLMIGDTSHDLLMAQNAGVASLAAGYGAHPIEHLMNFQPLACAQDFSALHQWLQCSA